MHLFNTGTTPCLSSGTIGNSWLTEIRKWVGNVSSDQEKIVGSTWKILMGHSPKKLMASTING